MSTTNAPTTNTLRVRPRPEGWPPSPVPGTLYVAPRSPIIGGDVNSEGDGQPASTTLSVSGGSSPQGAQDLGGELSAVRVFTGFRRPLLGISPLTATGGVLSNQSVAVDSAGNQSVTATLTPPPDHNGNLKGSRMVVTDAGTGQILVFARHYIYDYDYPSSKKVITTPLKGNVFEGSYATLNFDNSDGKAVAYEVRDFEGIVVATGPVLAGQQSLALPQILRYQTYTLWLRGQIYQGEYGYELGCTFFTLAPAHPSNTNLPVLPGKNLGSNGQVLNTDMGTGAWIGTPGRLPINNAASPDAEIAGIAALLAFQNQYYINGPNYINGPSGGAADPVKPRLAFVTFPNFRDLPGEAAGVTKAVVAFASQGVLLFEGPNEPDNNPGAGYVPRAKALYDAVKAGNPAAQVMGPCAVDGLPGLDAFLAAGGGQYIDVFSCHGYSASEDSLAQMVAVLTKYGQQNKARWMTELGFAMTEGGLVTPRRVASDLAHYWLLWDRWAFPAEHRPYWYTNWGGGFEFANFVLSADGSFAPQGALMRRYCVELYGKVFASRYAFGSGGSFLWDGNRYDAPTGSQQAGQSVSLFAPNGHRGQTLTLTVSGPVVPASLVCADAWGNETTLSVVNGHIALPPSDMACCYVRHASSLTLAPALDWGTDFAADPAASVIVPTNRVQAQAVISAAGTDKMPFGNLWGSGDKWFTGGGQYGAIAQADRSTIFPYDFIIDLGQNRTIKRLVFQGPEPYQGACGLISASVSTALDGTVNAVEANPGYIVTGTPFYDAGGPNGGGPANTAGGVFSDDPAKTYTSQLGTGAYVGLDAGSLFDLSSLSFSALQFNAGAIQGAVISISTGGMDGVFTPIYTIAQHAEDGGVINPFLTIPIAGKCRSVKINFPGRAYLGKVQIRAGVVLASVNKSAAGWALRSSLAQPANTVFNWSDQGTVASHAWDYWPGASTQVIILPQTITARYVRLTVERVSAGGQGDKAAGIFGGLSGAETLTLNKIGVYA